MGVLGQYYDFLQLSSFLQVFYTNLHQSYRNFIDTSNKWPNFLFSYSDLAHFLPDFFVSYKISKLIVNNLINGLRSINGQAKVYIFGFISCFRQKLYKNINPNFQKMNDQHRQQLIPSIDYILNKIKKRKAPITSRIQSSWTSQDFSTHASRDLRISKPEPNSLKDSKTGYLQEKTKKSSKNLEFLRHTTYASRNSQWFDPHAQADQEIQLKSSATLTYNFSKKEKAHKNQSISNCETHESKLKSFQKNSTIDLDRIVKKVNRTASYIKQLKQLQQQKRKQIRQKSKSYRQPKNNSIISQTSIQRRKNQVNAIYQQDLGFKKRIYDNYFTPKPQTEATVGINVTMEKMKRGFTPNTKKVVSPSHKKFEYKPRIQDFFIDTKLGGGKFGIVYRAYHYKTGAVYALKKISKKALKQNMLVDQFLQEVKIQSMMRHQNVMELYGVFDDRENVYMVLEFMKNGSLYSQLKKKGKFCEKQAAVIIKQISQGMVYMHDMGVAHRDLKPENIVISNGVYKICDFGWAAVCQDRRKTYCGTFDYTAPEIFEGGEYDLAVDLWGLGVIAYELMAGKPPFYHYSKRISIDNARNVQSKKINFPTDLTPSGISFIESLLRKNPQNRLCFNQILCHPFLAAVKIVDF